MREIGAMLADKSGRLRSKGAGVQGCRGEICLPLLCSSAPLLAIVVLIGLLLVLTMTACTSSSAATLPSGTNEAALTPTSTTTSGHSEFPQTSSRSPKSPSPTLWPTERPTATTTPSPTTTPTPTPSPSPTPTPSLRRLTRDGCCVQPFFSADGRQVLFIDKPAAGVPAGIYGVEIQNPATPALVDETIGFRSPDGAIVASMEDDVARFTNENSGQSWTVDTGGNWPRYSPDTGQIVWVATDREGPYDRRQSDVWLADLDGGNARKLLSVYGGGFAGWFPDGRRILLAGRNDPAEEKVTLFVYDLETGRRTNLASHERLRGTQISPEGSWIVFFLTFAEESAENGIWVASADGTERHKLDVPGFGAYRWRDDNTLLYIPMRTSPEESMQLWAVDVSANQSWPLTDPSSLAFSISNGDWDVSPDGRQLVFVNSADQNIWLITLP